VSKATVGAEGQHLCAQFLELSIFDGNCRQFGGSNKGEIARVKAQDDPLSFIV
jgi:hypothetical protein